MFFKYSNKLCPTHVKNASEKTMNIYIYIYIYILALQVALFLGCLPFYMYGCCLALACLLFQVVSWFLR